jgi:hypothetical protein
MLTDIPRPTQTPTRKVNKWPHFRNKEASPLKRQQTQTQKVINNETRTFLVPSFPYFWNEYYKYNHKALRNSNIRKPIYCSYFLLLSY